MCCFELKTEVRASVSISYCQEIKKRKRKTCLAEVWCVFPSELRETLFIRLLRKQNL